MAPPHSFEDLEDLARSLHSIGNRSYKIDTSTATVEANVAVTRFPEDGHSPERLIANLMATVSRRSDKGGSISFFNEVSYRAENQKYSIREQLRTAIERNELSLVYHPIVRINSGEALGAEVLLRWNNERFGPVSPGLFIPLAEEMGITTEITLWVMESASSELQRLRERSGGAEHYVHSLNLSPLDLAEPRFAPSVEQWISRSGIDPTLFELEITEGIVLDQNPRVGESLQRLRNLGFKLAMDDFGTGYSNLRYLNELHLTTVKIDQSFVRQINCHGEFSPVVEAIISMADSFGLRVTAEGVETAEQADYLTRAGCDTAQGYLYTKPLPIDDYASWLLASSPARV
jgi:EAL domain-containing protein (putative c-di-GMP-specific phosphodiesterase class I)